MAHNTSKLAKVLDFINREGFEWLMHPINHFRRYRSRYHNSWPTARFLGRFLFTLAFTAIPVIPALYVVSRAATLLSEPLANPVKTVLMTTVAAGIAVGVYMTGFGTLSALAATYMPTLVAGVGTALTLAGLSVPPVALAVVASGIVAGAFLTIAGALGFYGAKSAAQAINSYFYGDLRTTPKHQLPVSKNTDDNPSALNNIYVDILLKQKVLKEMAVTVPAQKDAILLRMGNEEDVPYGKAVETALEEGKQLLAGMETIVAESHQGTLTTEAYDHVLGNGLFHSYRAKVELINKPSHQNQYEGDNRNLAFAVAEDQLGTLMYSPIDNKIKSLGFHNY
jgi:hypothetical protein